MTVEDAARDLGCHFRTIWRDVDVLARAGFPIYDDKAGDGHRTVWRVKFRRLPLKLGLAEVLALLMSRDLLAAAGASVLGPDLASAIDKIRGLLSPDAQRLRDLPDGRLELTLQVADTQEVRRWILGWGAQAEVLQPIAMREALRQEALAMVEKLGRRGPGLARVGVTQTRQTGDRQRTATL